MMNDPDMVVWQRNYWDTILFPEEEDIQAVREYIRDNPKNWERDPENI